MSRSYKKTPYCGLPKDKQYKRYANRRLRRKKLTSDLQHKSYRKDMCSWNICDYKEIGTSFEKYWSRQLNFGINGNIAIMMIFLTEKNVIKNGIPCIKGSKNFNC